MNLWEWAAVVLAVWCVLSVVTAATYVRGWWWMVPRARLHNAPGRHRVPGTTPDGSHGVTDSPRGRAEASEREPGP